MAISYEQFSKSGSKIASQLKSLYSRLEHALLHKIDPTKLNPEQLQNLNMLKEAFKVLGEDASQRRDTNISTVSQKDVEKALETMDKAEEILESSTETTTAKTVAPKRRGRFDRQPFVNECAVVDAVLGTGLAAMAMDGKLQNYMTANDAEINNEFLKTMPNVAGTFKDAVKDLNAVVSSKDPVDENKAKYMAAGALFNAYHENIPGEANKQRDEHLDKNEVMKIMNSDGFKKMWENGGAKGIAALAGAGAATLLASFAAASLKSDMNSMEAEPEMELGLADNEPVIGDNIPEPEMAPVLRPSWQRPDES